MPASPEDQLLDSLILSVMEEQSKIAERRATESGIHPERPDDDSVASYISGKVDPSDATEIREALLESSGFRRRVVEAVKDMEELRRPETTERFEGSQVMYVPPYEVFIRDRGKLRIREEGRLESKTRTWPVVSDASRNVFRRALRNPLVAALLVIVVLAYPVIRYFFPGDASSGPESPLVLGSHTLLLPATPAPTTDPSSSSLPIVRGLGQFQILDVRIPVGASESDGWSVEISDSRGALWSSGTHRDYVGSGSVRQLRLRVDARQLGPGLLRVSVAPAGGGESRLYTIGLLAE